MFFILSKVLYFLIKPINWVAFPLLYFLWTKNTTRKRWALIITVSAFFFFTNHFIFNQVMRLWEVDTITADQIREPYDIGIILGGYSNFSIRPNHDRHNFNERGNRFYNALELYFEGKIQKLLLTGGTGAMLENQPSEASQMLLFLEKLGIPREDIILEPNSRNTRENALFTQQLIQDQYPNAKCLLITSAWHMRRSRACFRKVEVNFTPYSTDFIGEKTRFVIESLILPDRAGFYRWEILIKEIIGYIAYWAAGFL